MAISAAFTVDGNANPARHTTTYGATVNLALVSNAGIKSAQFTIVSSSKSGTTIPTLTEAGSPPGATASFAMLSDPGDGLGRAFRVRCVVTSQYETDTTYGIVGVPNAGGILPFCFDEERDRSTTGYIDELNESLSPAASVPNSSITPAKLDANAGAYATYAAARAALTAGSHSVGDTVRIASRATPGDGGEGEFRCEAIGSHVDNGGTILTGGSFALLRKYDGKVSVMWFGAVGDTVSNDTTACQAASNECTRIEALGGNRRPTLLLPEARGGYLLDSLTITSGVRYDQRAVIKSATSNGVVLDITGATLTTKNDGMFYRGIWVEFTGNPLTTWANETTSIGCVLRGINWSKVEHKGCYGFGIGMQIIGVGACAHNEMSVGEFDLCRHGMDLVASTGGYVNENLFLCGSWRVTSGSLQAQTHSGIRIYADGGETGAPNGNTFVKPSLEIGEPTPYPSDPLTEVATPIHITSGSSNRFIGYRNENNGNLFALCDGTSRANIFEANYDDLYSPSLFETGTAYGNRQFGGSWRTPVVGTNLLKRFDLAERAVNEGSLGYSFTGMGILTSSTGAEPVRVATGFTTDGISVAPTSTTTAIGTMVSTEDEKSFVVAAETVGAAAGAAWILIRAYDAGDNDITSGNVFGRQLTYFASQVGGQVYISDSERTFFRVSSDVVRVFVGVMRNVSFTALSVYANAWRSIVRVWPGDGLPLTAPSGGQGTRVTGTDLTNGAQTIQVTEGSIRTLRDGSLSGATSRAKTLGTTGAVNGDIITLNLLDDNAAETVTVVNGGTGGGTLVTHNSIKARYEFRFDGTDWSLNTRALVA